MRGIELEWEVFVEVRFPISMTASERGFDLESGALIIWVTTFINCVQTGIRTNPFALLTDCFGIAKALTEKLRSIRLWRINYL